MSIMLQDIGYKLVRKFDGKYPSETWEKEFSNGYDKHHLLFDTIHGGAWTVECYYQYFERHDDPNVFIPMGFNPNRDDTAGKGTWHMCDIPALDVRECAAIAEHITALECERKNARIDYLAGIASGMNDESDEECRITVSFIDDSSSDEPCHRWFMLSCGHSFTLDGLRAPVACPVCGKAVKR